MFCRSDSMSLIGINLLTGYTISTYERSGNAFTYLFMKALHYITFGLLVIGGLNWLLVGLFQWDIGMLFGGQAAMISRLIYILVGLSAIIVAATHKKDCKICSAEMPEHAM